MDGLKQWRETQTQEMEAFRDEAAQWQKQLQKDARDWKNATLREANSLINQLRKESQADFRASAKRWLKEMTQEVNGNKDAMQAEIDAMKGETTDGDSRSTGEGSGTADLLGSTDGAVNQTEADNSSGRKGRRRTSGTR